ncbi:hypothetical protein ABZP36_034931 [Zizania latifolia]
MEEAARRCGSGMERTPGMQRVPGVEEAGSRGEDGSVNMISEFGDDNFADEKWESKEIVSRDGHVKISSQVARWPDGTAARWPGAQAARLSGGAAHTEVSSPRPNASPGFSPRGCASARPALTVAGEMESGADPPTLHMETRANSSEDARTSA